MTCEPLRASPTYLPAFAQFCADLAEHSQQPFILLEGAAHLVRYANPAFCTLCGTDYPSLAGRRFAEAVPESGDNRSADLLDRVFRTGMRESLAEQPHGELQDAFWSYSAWAILGDGGGPVGVAVHITDASEIVTFRRQMTETNQALILSALEQHEHAELLSRDLRGAERLASVGSVSAGLGHDIGNLLLPVRMRLDAIEHETSSDAVKRDVAAIRVSFKYLQSLSNSLKLIAGDPHRAVAAGGNTNLAAWWSDFRPLIRGALPGAFALEEDFPASGGMPDAAINPTALAQSLFNLVQNSGEAMVEHGMTGGHVRIAAAAIPGADRVLITVSDDGPGMTPEVALRCTEPFFSTKTRRISTGMGLSIVKGLIEGSGGQLHVRSEPGRGTTFIIELAAVPPDGGPSMQTAAAAPSQGAPRRAALTVASPQAAAYLSWVIARAGAEPTVHADASAPDADLWFIEPREALTQPVRDFLRAGERRRVIIYGEPAGGLEADASGPQAASFTVIARSLPSPKVRPLLEGVLRDLRPQPAR